MPDVRYTVGENQARGPIALNIGELDPGQLVAGSGEPEYKGVAETVAALVEIDPDRIRINVDQIGRTRAVDVGQEKPGIFQPVAKVGRSGHGYRPAKVAVAQIGPVLNLAVAQPHPIAEAVADHVGKEEFFLGRGALLHGQVRPTPGGDGRLVPVATCSRIDFDPFFLKDQEVCSPVAGDIGEGGGGMVIVKGSSLKGLESGPGFFGFQLIEPGPAAGSDG